MTKHQFAALEYIKAYIAKRGYSPSYVEIMEHLSLQSKAGVHRIISALEREGYIKRAAKCARGITINTVQCRHCGKENP